jgi:peptidyl-tRNA hydrolase
MMSTTNEVSLYDIYLEAATRIFTNMQFLASAVEEDLRVMAEKQLGGVEKNPQVFADKVKQLVVKKEQEHALHIVNLYKEISKNNPSNVVQAVLLYKPSAMTRTQFANYVASAAAIPLVKADTHDLTKWYDMGMPKGFYEVMNTEFFVKVEKFCLDNDIAQHIIETSDGQMKAMGVGPSKIENISRITGNLKKL